MKLKWFSLGVILLLDFILLPSLLRFPSYFVQHQGAAASLWVQEFSIIDAGMLLFSDPPIQKLWLYSQLLIIAFIIMIFWSDVLPKKNKVQEGVGGPEAAGSGQFGTSRWQTEKETSRSASVWDIGKKCDKGGMILGVKDNSFKKAWMVTQDFHSIIIGATRSGKTRRLVFPTIWQLAHAGESMILTDPKGELYERTSFFLRREGYNVVCLDFREPGWGNHWNPMQPVIEAIKKNDLSKATKHAWSIAHMFVHQHSGSMKGEQIWNNGAESVIASLILAIATEAKSEAQKHMTSVYKTLAELGETQQTMKGDRIVDFVPLNEFMKMLPIDHPARDAFATARLAPERTRGSFYSTVAALLRLFSDPGISYLTSKQDHDLGDIGRVKTAVFLIIPDEDKTRHPLAALYVDQAYQALVDVANQNGGRLPIRVNNILDEFGNMPPIKDFDTKLTVSGGRGVRWNLIVQGFQQLKAAYDEAAETIKGNCHVWIYLLTQNYGTAKELSQKCGRYTIQTDNSSVNVRGIEASRGQSSGLTGRDLLTPDEITRWPEDLSLVLQARQYPARLYLPDLSLWPADKELIAEGGVVDRNIQNVDVFIPSLEHVSNSSNNSDWNAEEKEFYLDELD